MTAPDLAPRSSTLGVKLTEREKAAVMAAATRAGMDASVLVRNLLRDAEVLGEWSVEREHPAQLRWRDHDRPQAQHWAGLVGKWVDMSRPSTQAERDAGTPDSVGMAGRIVGVKDVGGGEVEILSDYGITFRVPADGRGWQLAILERNPEEYR